MRNQVISCQSIQVIQNGDNKCNPKKDKEKQKSRGIILQTYREIPDIVQHYFVVTFKSLAGKVIFAGNNNSSTITAAQSDDYPLTELLDNCERLLS
ncbi:MAG: hypothetical protein EZS28_009465 [Streblomastix strix]|uniref:Uncharacterized protein n=1 Tax=Streblomastix strix TaxID=222440 RepID=A0A5J4WJ36_9EUKA|nr:MAG: hypothetical protein EZS28_009465 [Streblomastix strix]